jgi:hypothetical protein
MEFVGTGDQRIDLHWHLLPDMCFSHADEEFWGRAAATTLHGVSVSVLDATDQLFHTCAHGVKWEHVPPLRWIADAAMILRDASVVIDWDRLVELARRLRLVLPLRDALTYLEHALGIPVPHPVQAALRNTPVSLAERWEYRLRTRPASPVLGRLLEHRLRYRRLRRAPGHLGEITFVGYLQVALECNGIAALIRRAIFRHRWRERAELEVRARERGLNRSAFP